MLHRYKLLCERALNQNDIENGFSTIASHTGYKPPVSQYLSQAAKLEFLERVKFDPHRGFRAHAHTRARAHACTRARTHARTH